MMGVDALAGARMELLAQAAILGAALCYTCASVYTRRLAGREPLVLAAGQVTATAVAMVPVALLVERPWALPAPGVTSLGAVLGLALFSTALAYLIYFRLIARAGATNLMLVSYLIPVTAIALGTAFLGERLAPHQWGGMALIALGLAAVDGRAIGWLRRQHTA